MSALDRAEVLADRFTVAAAALRHLLSDPLLPDALLPPDWPGSLLRACYDGFEKELSDLLRAYLAG